ncbi:RNA polymerase sigma factor [Roseococcus thiosulfatophilus]|uniref:RNA polymerase sigma factor n=1 Tax=Roseococcus thiosulfatophilus TaxID=35813 RepID=UPI001A8C2A9C|nr:sigma-70 family RNA polymerase sigma factor [Roseococcus thiosulfatophilus]
MGEDTVAAPAEVAFRAALVALMPALRGYGRALSGSVAAADELVQETLLRALSSERRMTEVGELRAWVFTILRHAWLSGLRAGRRLTPLEEGMEGVAGPADSLALDDLARAMRSLPAPQREAVVLMGAQGMSATEAAQICGVPEGTMRARLSRARSALRRALEPRLRTPPGI